MRVSISRTLRLLCATVWTFLAAMPLAGSAKAEQRLIVNIDSPSFRKLLVAVPTLKAADSDPELKKLAENASKELARLLEFSGLFRIIEGQAYEGLTKTLYAAPTDAAALEGIDLPAWKSVGVESLSVGELKRDGTDLTLAMRTADIHQGKLLVGKKYTKVAASQLDRVVARYADHILAAYTGKPGIFSTRLTFVGRRSPGAAKQIFISDFDGRNVVQVTQSNAPNLSPQWSRDGRFITYTSFEDGNPDLFIYEIATGKRRKLSGRKGLNSGGNWSPNNKLVAFTGSENGDADIYTIKPDGSGTKPLIRGGGLDVDPSFSPNGKWMAFVSGRFGNPHIFLADLKWDGDTSVRVLADKRLTYAGWYNATPAWSPDSERIAFAGYDRDINRFDLFIMNPDGTKLERLTLRSGDNERPSFSPNGQMIVFHSSRKDGKDVKGPAQLWVMNRDGGSQRQLKTGLFDAQTPQWGPPEE